MYIFSLFFFQIYLFIYYLKNCSLQIVMNFMFSTTISPIISVNGDSSNTTLENFNYSSSQFTYTWFPLINSQAGQINIINLGLKPSNLWSAMTLLSFTNSSALLLNIHITFLRFFNYFFYYIS